MSLLEVGESDEGDVTEDLCDGKLRCLTGDGRLLPRYSGLQPDDPRLHPVHLLSLQAVRHLQGRHSLQECS